MTKRKDAGDKKNTAGGSWVAGKHDQENLLIFGTPKNIVFRGNLLEVV